MRLNKFLAEAGVASRRGSDAIIVEGVVMVNGKVVTDLGSKVDPTRDVVTVRGRQVHVEAQLVYVLLNKPKDCITTSSDESGRTTVMDLVPMHNRIYPVGRLDRNTTGVILLTNDGDLAYRLTHPKFQVPKIYVATIDKQMHREHLQVLRGGVRLDDGTTAPCEAEILDPPRNTVIALRLREGRNRQVRRMFEALEYDIRKLERVDYAGLTAEGLKRGAWRPLEEHEVKYLKKLTAKIPPRGKTAPDIAFEDD